MFDHGYALLIGVDENKLPNLALPTVKKDVTKLKEVLTHPERCGYLEENVHVLTGTDATHAKILDGLEWLKEKLAGDTDKTAFIYYSGHGHCDSSGEAFLIPYDARYPITTGSLRAQDFAASLDSIRPKRLLVVLDCCHAESMNVKDIQQTGLSRTAITSETKGAELLAQGEGRAVLSSSLGTQLSYIRSDGKMSVFTYHLVEALMGHGVRPDWPEITVTELMAYVGRTVPETVRTQHNAEQVPFVRFSGTAFPIALVLGGKGVAKGMTPPDPLAKLPGIRARFKAKELTESAEGTNVRVKGKLQGPIDAEAEIDKISGEFTNVHVDSLES